jgi:hypothetical protein
MGTHKVQLLFFHDGIFDWPITKKPFRQNMWDKLKCYWEHVEEHMKNLGEMLN